jgi:signal transduction histidine kinase/integral membrane sensor domain MASE1
VITDTNTYSRKRKALVFLSVAILYFCLGWISLKFATINDFASPIWSPSGFAMGALVVFGSWLAPAIFLGAFFTNLTVSPSIASLLGIATGNMLEAIVGASLIFWILEKNRFKYYSEFVALICAALLGSMVSATFGVSTLLMNGVIAPLDYGYTWYTWWSGDAVGILLILPLFLELHLSPKNLKALTLQQVSFAIAYTSIFFFLTYLVFVKDYNPAFAWIICPFLTLAGIYLDKLISRIILIGISVFIVGLTMLGYSPFEFGSLNLNLISVQSLLVSYAIAVLFVRPLSADFKTGKTFILTNLFGWTTIFIIIFITSSLEKQNMQDDLQDVVQISLEDINKTTNHYELLLEGGAALLQIKPTLTNEEWIKYQYSIKLESKFDAIVGFGFARNIQKSDEKKFQNEIQSRGVKDFFLRQFNEKYSQQFPDRFLVTFLEPKIPNTHVNGLDLGSERFRREAAEKAWKTNKTVATESIRLFQDGKKQMAFSLFHPVWTEKNKLAGWTFAPIITNTFYTKVFSQYQDLLNLKISYNGLVVFQNHNENEAHFNKNYVRELKVMIFGMEHTLSFYPRTAYFQSHSHSSAPLALLMTLLMLFIAGFLLEQLTFGQRAEKLIQKRTSQLEDSKIQLINSSKMASLGEMASGMAHEINNPITIILGKIKVIRFMLEDLKINHLPLNDEISRIEHSTGRISKIVKGLKSFSRAAKEDPFELIPLETIIQETLDLCAERLKANGIKLIIDPIPQVCLFCRPSQISQVFLNMFNNSSDALTTINEKYIKINFKIQEPDRIFISIVDSGPGIPPQIASRIMEPFFTTKNVGKGTGLGLSIAKGIIEDHGGTIKFDEKSSRTRFVIELPLKNVSLIA